MSPQSDDRAPRRRADGMPASFGRGEPAEPEDFTIRGGHSIHVVVHADVTPTAESLEALRAAIRDVTRIGVLEGYAAAAADLDDDDLPGDAAPPPDNAGG